ncbi:MAG: YkgJ family cysteine cluster protein [Phycisphaerae bacterium]
MGNAARKSASPPPEPPEPWYADGLHFACTQCGNCCGGAPGYVWVDEVETRKIAAFLNLDVTDFATRYVRAAHRRKSLIEYRNGDCVFLQRDGKGKASCSIHPVRPLQCRTWPFWNSNLASKDDWDYASKNCPGMNRGPHHALPVIQAALADNDTARLPL